MYSYTKQSSSVEQYILFFHFFIHFPYWNTNTQRHMVSRRKWNPRSKNWIGTGITKTYEHDILSWIWFNYIYRTYSINIILQIIAFQFYLHITATKISGNQGESIKVSVWVMSSVKVSAQYWFCIVWVFFTSTIIIQLKVCQYPHLCD